jgi:hypothetical protein
VILHPIKKETNGDGTTELLVIDLGEHGKTVDDYIVLNYFIVFRSILFYSISVLIYYIYI